MSDFVDYTLLSKKGFFKEEVNQIAPELVDLTSAQSASPASLPPAPAATPSPSLDFLTSFAQVGASEPSSYTSTPSSHNPSLSGFEPKLDTILSKIEDTMYKIETLSSRVMQLESRIESLSNSGLR